MRDGRKVAYDGNERRGYDKYEGMHSAKVVERIEEGGRTRKTDQQWRPTCSEWRRRRRRGGGLRRATSGELFTNVWTEKVSKGDRWGGVRAAAVGRGGWDRYAR